MDAQDIGQLLVARQLLTPDQLRRIGDFETSLSSGFRQTALSADENLSDQQLWERLASQIVCGCRRVNLIRESYDESCLRFLDPHAAWDHLVLPLRMDGVELVCATTEETAATALPMLYATLSVPFRLVISDIRLLEQFIAERYAFEGVDIRD